jgi:hypothetical protein
MVKQALMELAVFLAVTLLVAFVFDVTSDQDASGLYVIAVVLAVAVTVSSVFFGWRRERPAEGADSSSGPSGKGEVSM